MESFATVSVTLPETNIGPEIGLPNRKVGFQPSIFRGKLLVSGRVSQHFRWIPPKQNPTLTGEKMTIHWMCVCVCPCCSWVYPLNKKDLKADPIPHLSPAPSIKTTSLKLWMHWKTMQLSFHHVLSNKKHHRTMRSVDETRAVHWKACSLRTDISWNRGKTHQLLSLCLLRRCLRGLNTDPHKLLGKPCVW